jgi:hypothetical protein
MQASLFAVSPTVSDRATPPLTEITEITTDFRLLFEHLLESSLAVRETKGSCLHAAILLSDLLEKFAGASTQVKGGGPESSGGVFDQVGKCHGHYWVEGATKDGIEFIADVTADQFGFAKVIVLPTAAGRHIYSPGAQAEIDGHVREERDSWPA